MNAIRILAETPDSVTISRKDWADLLAGLEDVEDRAAVSERRAREATLGKEAARRNYLTADEVLRLLDGENPVRLWREKRGFSQRQLATAANISPSYLAEIETGRKPGSADALGKLAEMLGVPKEDLTTELQRLRDPDFGPVYLRWWPQSVGVAPGKRGAGPTVETFPTVRAMMDAVRGRWDTLKNHGFFVETADGRLIYDHLDFLREIDPRTYEILHMQAGG